jgi:hypothetical protein
MTVQQRRSCRWMIVLMALMLGMAKKRTLLMGRPVVYR